MSPPYIISIVYGMHFNVDMAGKQYTVGKRNYFTGYGILLRELLVVAVLFTQSNNNEGTMKNSILQSNYLIFSQQKFTFSQEVGKVLLH